MQFFLSTNRAKDKVLCVFVVFSSLLSLFHLWISVMLSELDEIAEGFSLLFGVCFTVFVGRTTVE